MACFSCCASAAAFLGYGAATLVAVLEGSQQRERVALVLKTHSKTTVEGSREGDVRERRRVSMCVIERERFFFRQEWSCSADAYARRSAGARPSLLITRVRIQRKQTTYFLQMKPAIWHCLTLSNPTTLTLYPGYSSWQFWISARTSSPDWHPNMGSFHMVQYLFS